MNQLTAETSPYLLQHKDNPVHWYPWGDRAFQAAAAESKPTLVSIGYAACHWCHVMAHESFEDPVIAAQINNLFIAIKIDREERPDLDNIYQSALALLGQQGGWPLTIFCTDRGEPFWGGTYFPPEPRYGQPGFPQILDQLATLYQTQPAKITQNVDAIAAALTKINTPAPRDTHLPLPTPQDIADLLTPAMDPQFGGLGKAPKFPHTPVITLLWHLPAHRETAKKALDHMAQGGIYDHLAGGFARYTVDRAWLVPHFEKMLCDNAQLIEVYTQAWQATANPPYAERVAQSIAWLQRDMCTKDVPAFTASYDADSEGEEGRYYVWDIAETTSLLKDQAPLFHAHYDVTKHGNWEGKNILNRSAKPQLVDQETEDILAQCRNTLLVHRTKRIPPTRDDKILADWNGLTIAALAQAAYAFNQPDWQATARQAFDFIAHHLQPAGRLHHVWRLGTAKHRAMLDDYANLARAALILFESDPDPALLAQAEAWVAELSKNFAASAGGFYLTAEDATDVLHRVFTAADNATPPGNATMVEVLARLYHHTGKDTYRQQAANTLAAFSGAIQASPTSHVALTNAGIFLEAPVNVAISGPHSDPSTQNLHQVLRQTSLPALILTQTTEIRALPQHHPAHDPSAPISQPAAIVCHGQTCSLPLTSPQDLTDHLQRL